MPELLADGYRFVDHRPTVGGYVNERGDIVGAFRDLVDLGATALRIEPIAVRGEHLALVRETWDATTGEVVTLNVVETDGDGLLLRDDAYEADDLESAIAVLEEHDDDTRPPSHRATP